MLRLVRRVDGTSQALAVNVVVPVPVLLAVTLVVAVATVVGSVFADVCYALLDPRIRYAHA